MGKLSKLKYGFNRLLNELISKEDYWHLNMPYRKNTIPDLFLYPLDITKKAEYPFDLKEGVPIVLINGQDSELVITILSYGLGLLDVGSEKNREKLNPVIKWLITNQDDDGSWKTNYEDQTYKLKSGWYSGMVQGMAISFFTRIVKHKLIDKIEGDNIIEKALQSMLSDKTTTIINNQKIIDEYGGTNTGVLNGFIFSLISLWDYGVYKNDYSLFKVYENSLKNILKKYNFGFWSYYDIKGTVASGFYHRLHIEMLMWVNSVSPNNIYEKNIKRWKIGIKLKGIYVFFKAFQKFSHLSKTDTLNS